VCIIVFFQCTICSVQVQRIIVLSKEHPGKSDVRTTKQYILSQNLCRKLLRREESFLLVKQRYVKHCHCASETYKPVSVTTPSASTCLIWSKVRRTFGRPNDSRYPWSNTMRLHPIARKCSHQSYVYEEFEHLRYAGMMRL